MKPILAAPLLGIAFLVPVVAQDTGARAQPDAQTVPQTTAEKAAQQELNQAAHSYFYRNFVKAQQHSEQALALDPSNKNAALFIARTIHAQYQPGVYSEANVAKAHEAIDAYNRVRVQEPLNDESYKAIAYLYENLKDDEQHRLWVFQRALDLNVSADKRAEAYLVLASKAWDCSFMITSLPTQKSTAVFESRVRVQYIKPKDPADFEKARQCAADGLEFAEAAITITPNSGIAWSHKSNLLLQMSKLAEMDQNSQLKTEYEREWEAALLKTRELEAENENGQPGKP